MCPQQVLRVTEPLRLRLWGQPQDHRRQQGEGGPRQGPLVAVSGKGGSLVSSVVGLESSRRLIPSVSVRERLHWVDVGGATLNLGSSVLCVGS